MKFKSLLTHTALAGAALAIIGTPVAAGATKRQNAAVAKADDGGELPTYGQREDVLRFAGKIAERRGLDASWVEARSAVGD